MSNIFNHNKTPITTCLNRKDCWDFCLSNNNIPYADQYRDNKFLITDIDINNHSCVQNNQLVSSVFWKDAINNGILFKNIGYTGMDNGLIKFQKDRTSNKVFLDMLLNSIYEITSNKKELILTQIDGNNQIYDYNVEIVNEDGVNVLKCNGGFYQGFWQTDKCDYKILPDVEENGLCFEITLKPSDLKNDKHTLNDNYINNKGLFLYLGTRSENKWFKYYNITDELINKCDSYFSDDYFNFEENDSNIDYCRDNTFEELVLDYLDKNGYISNEYLNYPLEDFKNRVNLSCSNYFKDDYIGGDVNINENDIVSDGENPLSTPQTSYEIRTDNKFLLFDRTENGFTTKNWVEGTELILEKDKEVNVGNYFLLFNRTENGYTTKTIQTLLNQKKQEYSILDDLYNNAIGFQIKDDGSIGYKYLVKDCLRNTYKIETEFSKPNIIKKDEWSKINIQILPIDSSKSQKKMMIKIYVNNKLKFISRELDLFNFRKLNESYEKQEGVPFNLSLGGGTQGLIDAVYPNYKNYRKYILPLEREFCGTFIGYIKNMKIYNCRLNIQQMYN